jgi:hypothetical protein
VYRPSELEVDVSIGIAASVVNSDWYLFGVPGPTSRALDTEDERSLVIDGDEVVAIRSAVGSVFDKAILGT